MNLAVITVDFDHRRRFWAVSAEGGRKKKREKKRENLESGAALSPSRSLPYEYLTPLQAAVGVVQK
ncbi:hypothetical protein BHE74_00022014, partial [Ensete ventricosum]